MRVFLKQYGAMRTGTNYLRMLIQANYSDVVALMHVLGDKHSPPVPLEELWRDAQSEDDPALAFVSRATAHAPALSTKPDDADQRREVERIATALTQAYLDGAIGFVISIKDPYAWVVSVAKYAGMASRHSVLGPQLAEAMAKMCAEYNASYAAWFALAERLPSRCHVVRHEDLVEDPERVLAALDAKFGLQRSSQAFVNITRETFPAWWDQNRPRTTGVMFDRSYYLGRRYLERLSPEVRDAVTESIDWERIAPFGYIPLESPLPAARGEGNFETRIAVFYPHMADPALRLSSNVDGEFFVDSTCIDCDACRIFAPTVFSDEEDQSFVFHQPESDEELLAAQRALISCPTASIGTTRKHDMTAALASLPELVAENVYRCGYTSESSFGAISYLIRRDGGNVLVDSPRFTAPLAKNVAALGGAARMLLTHQDDVADHDKFHERFGCERVLHKDDVRTRTAAVEVKPSGFDPIELDRDLLMIPTPGHTKGHAVFLYRETFLFTGDHLAWSPARGHLYAFRSACWYSWSEQIRSMERLLDYRFEWVLPGHGRPIHLPAAEMRRSLEQCVEWMKERTGTPVAP